TTGGPNESSLVKVDTATLAASPIAGTTFDPYNTWGVKIAASGSRFAWWVAPYASAIVTSDGKVHVGDVASAASDTTPALDGLDGIALGSGGLAVSSYSFQT